MMTEDENIKAFGDALAFTTRDDIEGGWYAGNEARDPNPTMRGITQKTYDAYRRGAGKPQQSVRNITHAELHTIYERDYWNAAQCDRLGPVSGAAHFEAAVNCGSGTAVLLLQRVLGVAVDGFIGPITRVAIHNYLTEQGDHHLANRLLWERLRYYRDLGRNTRLRPNLLAWVDRTVKFQQVFNVGMYA